MSTYEERDLGVHDDDDACAQTSGVVAKKETPALPFLPATLFLFSWILTRRQKGPISTCCGAQTLTVGRAEGYRRKSLDAGFRPGAFFHRLTDASGRVRGLRAKLQVVVVSSGIRSVLSSRLCYLSLRYVRRSKFPKVGSDWKL